MSNLFCINKSGSSIPVYGNSSGGQAIGSIGNREAFAYDRNWGGDDEICHIRFLNSSGSLAYGFILHPASSVLTPCNLYPYSKETIILDGKTYTNMCTFYMRKRETIYKSDASVWGAVAAGCKVACIDGKSGDSHPEWKKIEFVLSSSGSWVKVNSNSTDTYGFVDTGLSYASGYGNIPFYGSW